MAAPTAPRYDILVPGSSLALAEGFIGISTIVLIEAGGLRIVGDCGHAVTRVQLRAALARRKLAPEDIDILFLSHLHNDHCLNADVFPKARVLVGRDEWNYADKPHRQDDFIPAFIKPWLSTMRLEVLEGEPEIAPGVTVLKTPGHTPGHLSLVLEGTELGRAVIAFDAIKTARELLSEEIGMEFDAEKRGVASIRAIKALADRIVPGHFPEFRKLANGGWSWDANQPLNLVFR